MDDDELFTTVKVVEPEVLGLEVENDELAEIEELLATRVVELKVDDVTELLCSDRSKAPLTTAMIITMITPAAIVLDIALL